MLVHRMVKKVKDSKVWAKINTKDGGPGSGVKGHTTAEEPTKARLAAKAEEPAKSGEGKSFVSKEHAQAYINGAAKTASKLLGAGVKQGYTGFEWSKKGGYADVKMKLTRMKIEKAGFKEVDFDQADHPAGNWTRNTTTFQNENGDVIKMTSRYGETSRQNSHSVAYTPKDFNKAKERFYAQDSDPRGYKVSDQIIKGFLIYKSGKGPATFFAKNENGKEFEGSMEEIKKQIDAYWVKQDEDVMKQKVRDYQMASGQTLSKPGWYLVDGNDRPVDGPYPESVAKKKAEELGQDATYFSEYDIKRMSSDSKTKDEELQPNQKIAVTKLINFKGNKAQYKNGNRIYEVEKDKTGAWHLTGEYEYTGDKKTKDVGGFIGVATTKAGKYFTGYKKQEKSPRFDTEEKANEWCRFRMQRSDAKYIAKCEVVPTNDSKTKDKAYHPRWHIKDDKLFRLRSAIKKAKTKDVELSNRAVWRKEDFDKMVAAGNFTIVSKQPWGYEVKVKSGNIYGVEIRDTYTKGSADRKTKDDAKSDELKMMIQQMGKVEGIKAFAKKYPEYVPQFASYFKKKVGEREAKDASEVKYKEPIKPGFKPLNPPIDPDKRATAKEEQRKLRSEFKDDSKSKDKLTGDPLTAKGRKIMAAMREKYGAKKGKQVFFASRNKGTIKNVDPESMDSKTKDDLFETIRKIRNSSGAIVGTIAIYDAVGEFVVETWNLKSGKDVKKVVKRFPYEGNEDRKAALTMARGFVNTYPDYEFKDSKTKDEAVQMQCNECGKRFKKNITSSTVEVKCPACGGYDTDVDEPAGKVITQR